MTMRSSRIISWVILTVCQKGWWIITGKRQMCRSGTVKDASDTEIALRLCIGLNRKEIWILGGTGNRIDHLWANIQCLQIALDAGADARILDSHNQIRLLDKGITLKREEAFGKYFSLPMELPVDALSITGAKYPLKDHFLRPDDSLCVSNEFAEEEVTISFSFGKVILMETRD